MYLDKNRLVLRDKNYEKFTIAYPSKDGKRYLLVTSDKVVEARYVHKYGRFQDEPIVLVKDKGTKREIKTYHSIRLLSKEDVVRLEKIINQKHYENHNSDYKVDDLVVMTPKDSKTRDLYICLPHEDDSVYVISKNKVVPASEMEEIGSFDGMYCNIILTEVKGDHGTITPKRVTYVHELTERDVNSLESKLNAEKVAFSYNDQSDSIEF